MEKLMKSFNQNNSSEERRVLLHKQDDPMAQREVLVKINAQDSPMVQRRTNANDVALVHSANSSFHLNSSLLRMKTKSRLMDPPEQSQKKQLMKPGMMLGSGGGMDEDDPFLDDDLPEEYKKMTFSASSVAQLVSLVFILAALACSLGFPKLVNKRLFGLEIWKWKSMVLVLISGHLVSGWAIRVFVYFLERNFLLRKRVLYFVYGVRNAIQNCIWLGLVLISWQLMFDRKAERMSEGNQVFPFLARVWVCVLVGTLIWLLKTLVIKALASSFHVSKFFGRILESLFNQYVIETLSGPPLLRIQHKQVDVNLFPRNGKVIGSGRYQKGDEGITIDHLHSLNQKNVSAWNMKRLMSIVRKGFLSTLNERVKDLAEDESAAQITSEYHARAAAKKIFYNVAKPEAKRIDLEDLMCFLGEDEASKTMSLIQGASEGKGISKRALKNWVVNAFRERRALSLSLNDTKSAVNKLRNLLNIVVAILILAIWLLILQIAGLRFFVFLGSQFLLVFMLGKYTWKTTIECIIFLFVTHPFDVGDRCEVDGVQMVVEEMNILTTVFLRFDNLKIIYPNNVLATKPIRNYYRSPGMGDAVDFCIHISTPMEKVAKMKEKITRYVESRSDHWYPAPIIALKDVEDMNKLKISVWLSHRMNHQDMDERWVRRTHLIEEMINIFRELDIQYRMLPFDVNVRNIPAISVSGPLGTLNACVNMGNHIGTQVGTQVVN